jgi:hypothetical protein
VDKIKAGIFGELGLFGGSRFDTMQKGYFQFVKNQATLKYL